MANQGPPSSLRAQCDVTVEPDCSAERVVGVVRCSGVGGFPPLLLVIRLKLEKENGGKKNPIRWNAPFFCFSVVVFLNKARLAAHEASSDCLASFANCNRAAKAFSLSAADTGVRTAERRWLCSGLAVSGLWS